MLFSQAQRQRFASTKMRKNDIFFGHNTWLFHLWIDRWKSGSEVLTAKIWFWKEFHDFHVAAWYLRGIHL